MKMKKEKKFKNNWNKLKRKIKKAKKYYNTHFSSKYYFDAEGFNHFLDLLLELMQEMEDTDVKN